MNGVASLLTPGATVALIGSSGHGKSTLVNALVGAQVLATRTIRDDGKGRHTTVRRELVVVPGGGVVVDTPGLRGVGLYHDEGGLTATFSELADLAERCAYRDCRHQDEPGCAVADAVAAGLLPVRRWESWRRLSDEVRRAESRASDRLRRQQAVRRRLRA